MLVGQDWGCPWDEGSHNIMSQIALANRGEEYQYLERNPSVTDNRLIRLFQEIGYEDISQPNPELFFTNFILGYRNKGPVLVISKTGLTMIKVTSWNWPILLSLK